MISVYRCFLFQVFEVLPGLSNFLPNFANQEKISYCSVYLVVDCAGLLVEAVELLRVEDKFC